MATQRRRSILQCVTRVGVVWRRAVRFCVLPSGAKLHSGNTCEPHSYSDEQTIHYLQLAADKGHDRALFNLGVMYDAGKRVKSDPKRARTFYRRAARSGSTKAHTNLGKMLEIGRGGRMDKRAAQNHYEKAAKEGELSILKRSTRVTRTSWNVNSCTEPIRRRCLCLQSLQTA